MKTDTFDMLSCQAVYNAAFVGPDWPEEALCSRVFRLHVRSSDLSRSSFYF